MNEQIRELAEQVDACYIPRYDIWQMDTESLKKFSEVLLEEMYDFIMNESANDNGIPDLGKVKQHFGVK